MGVEESIAVWTDREPTLDEELNALAEDDLVEMAYLPSDWTGVLAHVFISTALGRAAQKDLVGAAVLLGETIRPLAPAMDDWPDRLAQALRRDPDTALETWAAAAGLAPATVSRGFRQAFGASPRRYRAEQRALKAAQLLLRRDDPPAALAAELGFSDQAHMTRAVAALTGLTPGRLRVKWMQSEGRPVG